MKLIADSGATRTQWRYLSAEHRISQLQSEGMNPWQQDDQQLRHILDEQVLPELPARVEEVWFYGSGCLPGPASDRLAQVLQQAFPEAHVSVADDLLAVARGLCGTKPGIACILGTGSNSCDWDGRDIVDRVPALGYILGDEGSASYLGRQLLHAWFKRSMPAHIREAFQEQFHPEQSVVLQQVYKEPNAGRYLGSFSPFLADHRDDPWAYRLLYDAFISFLEHNVLKYEDLQNKAVHFSGAIAQHYGAILRQAGQDKGLYIGHITDSPIAGLLLYHQENDLI